MAGFTNRGKALMLQWVYPRTASLPANFYVALVTATPAPTADTNTLGELTQIAAGNGYVDGGYQLSPNSTDFDVLTEDDPNDKAILMIKDIVWLASGGALPASGGGARYAVLTTDEGTIGNRQVIAFWDLVSDRSVAAGVQLKLVDLQSELIE